MPWGASINARFSQMKEQCPQGYWKPETLINWVKNSDKHPWISAKEMVLDHIKECKSCKKWMKDVPLEKVIRELE
jgi:hypothetical protein